VVFMYAVLGGMKGVTYTQVAQYCVLIFAYMVPAIYISLLVTEMPIPQIGLGASVADGSGLSVLQKLDSTLVELGFTPYTEGTKSKIDVFAITMALMLGTAGLPHVIVRFFTVPKVSDARKSAGYALFFIALLYTTAPAVGAFARLNIIDTIHETAYTEVATWFTNWETVGLIGWVDKNSDGLIQYGPGEAFDGKPSYSDSGRGAAGERIVTNKRTSTGNEVYVDRDIIVLTNPEIANLPPWVIALVAAGALAAALSTAAGLLLVISAAVSHDLLKKTLARGITDQQELLCARLAAATAIGIAGYLGVNPPGFVAQVVAFAFGLAAASLFPPILLGIFSKRMNLPGAVCGMLVGLVFTFSYIVYFKFYAPELNLASHWLFGISPEGIGLVGAALNFVVAWTVALLTAPPPPQVLRLIDNIRLPSGVSSPYGH
ncbi:MAG: VC_2705 family sodium/solute symporter, partial [Proteobacteria bacterium]|nr:VC_2705 family sodium/solute symporter [Pseudomonadota bacterium]